MARLEDLMAGLFGGNTAPGADELRRRQRGPGSGGYDSIGGAMVAPGQLMPYYSGLPGYDFSGAQGRQFQGGGRGLESILREASAPALRHFARQGFDFMPPGQDQREMPGGPNIAPGNIDNAQALNQPQSFTPGVPQGVARGFETAPGQVRPTPRTQGWRNLAPGGAVAAFYGSGSGDPSTLLGAAQGPRAPGASAYAPGVAEGRGPGGGGLQPGGPAGPGGRPAGPGPVSQNPVGAAPAPGPAGGGGGPGGGRGQGGGGGTVSGAAGGQGTGGQQQQGPRPGATGGRTGPDDRTGGAGGGREGTNPLQAGFGQISDIVGDVFGGAAQNAQGGRNPLQTGFGQISNMVGDVFGAAAANATGGGRTAGVTRPGGGNKQGAIKRGGKNKDGGRPGNQGMYAGETKAERQARLAAKGQRQDARAAREAAQAARLAQQTAAATTAAGRPVNMTTAVPQPTAGKTKKRTPKTGTSLIGGPQI